ncbi:ThiJ/PfpI, partial [Mycena rosella]
MPSILLVFSSVSTTLTGAPTGWYLPEAAHPYYVLSPHASIDFASPAGPNPPVDPESVKLYESDAECVKFLDDETVQTKLSTCKKLADVIAKDYDLIFYVGGQAPVIDLAVDPINIKLATEFYRSGKITSAVCHGPAALVGVTDAQGKSIFSGRSATGFSNAEEIIQDKVKDVPFLLEDRIKSLGGKYEAAEKPWAVKVVVDGNLYTGQNPASARALAETVLKAMK